MHALQAACACAFDILDDIVEENDALNVNEAPESELTQALAAQSPVAEEVGTLENCSEPMSSTKLRRSGRKSSRPSLIDQWPDEWPTPATLVGVSLAQASVTLPMPRFMARPDVLAFEGSETV